MDKANSKLNNKQKMIKTLSLIKMKLANLEEREREKERNKGVWVG